MEITWYGHSCFRLTERGLAAVVTDPYDDSLGYPALRLKADIVTVSHDARGHSNLDAVKGEARAITGPGEYEIGGVFVTGIATQKPGAERAATNSKKKGGPEARTNTIYVFDCDGLTVAHLGDLDHVPTQSQIEALGAVDVALVPVGGGGLNAAQAAEVVSLLEPSLVIPMHYRTDAGAAALDPVSKFLKEMGMGAVTPEAGLKVTKSSLPEETHVVVLECKTA
ncbi:MAG: MBL fold metallo-hydrolase [Anaerolineales bacterium]|nr:MBL fold metallo-hydrolase [Anaerolineales bacterium]